MADNACLSLLTNNEIKLSLCQILAINYYCVLILYLLKSVAIHTAYTAVRENSSRSRNIPHSSITLLR